MKTILSIYLPERPKNFGQSAFKESVSLKSIQLEWALWDHEEDHQIKLHRQGQDNISSIPLGDFVIALIPNVDTLFLQLDLPLVNSQKLSLALPGLIEDQLLVDPQQANIHVLMPPIGFPPLLRTVVVINKKWQDELQELLSGIGASKLCFVPDGIALQPHQLGYKVGLKTISFATQLTPQLVHAWSVEFNNSSPPERLIQDAQLASNTRELIPMNLTEITPAINEVIHKNHINLYLRGKPNYSLSINSWITKWFPLDLWKTPVKLVGATIATYIIGLNLFWAGLEINEYWWKYNFYRVTENSSTNPGKANPIKNLLIEKSSQSHRMGLNSPSDFKPLANKLTVLMQQLQLNEIKHIHYDGLSLVFELPVVIDSAKVLQKSRVLGLSVKSLGKEQYRLDPFPFMDD